MKLFCYLFGHQHPDMSKTPGGNFCELVQFNTYESRIHLYVKGNCPRCGERYYVGFAHLPAQFQLREPSLPTQEEK